MIRKPQGNLVGVPTGKVKKREDGMIEAEFISISPRSNCSKIWATKEELT